MDWQQAVALIIVAGTAGAFLWARMRPRAIGLGRQSPCGCSSGKGTQDSIIFHARKGERPQILVKAR